MEALRIHLTQSSANYKREEIIENKMTYPLPPFSTIIGALHSICGFTEYIPIDISVQGDYHALGKEAYIDNCILNNLQDDRGVLVKMLHSKFLSPAFQKAGYAMKSQGNSFRNNITVMPSDEKVLTEYRELKDLNDKLSEFKKGKYTICMAMLKRRKDSIALKKKQFHKEDTRFKKIEARELEIKSFENRLKEKTKEYEEMYYNEPISYFKTITTSLKFYEVLYDIELVIHVKSDTNTLHTILEHIYDWKSLGRSEDFVEIKSASLVELEDNIDRLYKSKYHAYLDANLIDTSDQDILIEEKQSFHAQGTKYYINKNYVLSEPTGGKRIFEKKKVYYASSYSIEPGSRNVFVDNTGESPLIVNFL